MGAAPAAAMVAVAGSSSALKELENARRSPPPPRFLQVAGGQQDEGVRAQPEGRQPQAPGKVSWEDSGRREVGCRTHRLRWSE